jgi:hypothetical protein
MAAIATRYMNKTQSLDGIIGPHHAKHAGCPGMSSVALKAEAAQSVRRTYKHVIVQELADMEEQDLADTNKDCSDMDEVDPEILDARNNHGQHCYGAELRHLVADVQKLMADAKVLSSDVQFVNHSCGSITWEEFVASMSEFTYYQGTWNIEGLTDLFCVVGTDWWIKVIICNDSEGLYFYRAPRRLPYHITPTAECVNPAF